MAHVTAKELAGYSEVAPAESPAAESPEVVPPEAVSAPSQAPAFDNGGYPEPEWVEGVYITWPYLGISWSIILISQQLNKLAAKTENKVDDKVAAFFNKLAMWTGWVLDFFNGTLKLKK